jgi:hypothetical protein
MLSDVTESGPFGLLHKIRYWSGVRFDATSDPYGTNNFADGLLCMKCNSVWIGLVMTGLLLLSPIWVTAAYLPLALSGFVLFMEDI